MRNYTFLMLGLLVLAKADAQIVLEQDWLVSPGFEITLGVDVQFTDPNNNIDKAGANQVWDFGQLGDRGDVQIKVADAQDGIARDSFPNADLLLTSRGDAAVFGVAPQGSESYLSKIADDLLLLGFVDGSPDAFLPALKLDDPLTIQSTPIAFNNSGSDVAQTRITFGPELLEFIVDDPAVLALIDSIGFKIGQQISYTVDGYGTLRFNNEQYDALRIRSVTETTQELELKVPLLGWVPATQFIPASDLGSDFGTQSNEDLSWVVAEYSWPVVQIALDSIGEPEQIRYRSDAVVGTRESAIKAELGAYHLGNELIVEMVAPVALTNSQMLVMSTDGRELVRVGVAGNSSRQHFDTTTWSAGIVLVVLLDEQNHLIATRRVSVMR